MGVKESGRHLEALAQAEAPQAQTWQQAMDEFLADLRSESDPESIVALLDEDTEDNLPIEAKTAAFERALELGAETPELLGQYADHLWFHGPESDEKAAALKRRAEQIKQEAALEEPKEHA